MPAILVLLLLPGAEPLHVRIDRLLDDAAKARPVSPRASDGEFLRRVTLDLTGTLPGAEAARAFLDSRDEAKRARLVETLLASPAHPRRMADLFHVHLMERNGDNAAWGKWLQASFARNRPWDEMARDMLGGRVPGASFWMSRRLEHYGQNPVDYPGLARDIGRLFLGKDLRCAQCHDHLFIREYKQADFQGLFAFVQNAYLADPAKGIVAEKAGPISMEFVSVFGSKGKQRTGPRVPDGKEIVFPALKKGEEWLVPPDRKKRTPGVPRISPLASLARVVPASPDFSRNIVNRLWWVMMGRGLVHPLDQHHAGNKPSHPALLDLLAREFVAHKHDIRWLLRELALTRAYQRGSELPSGETKLVPHTFRTALEKRLSAEQLLEAMQQATGERPAAAALARVRTRFVKAFAGPIREPEEEFNPALKSAFFLLNDPLLQEWLHPRSGNLVERLARLPDGKVAELLYLSVLTRRPEADESAAVAAALKGKGGKERPRVLGRLAWALLASTEFNVNH